MVFNEDKFNQLVSKEQSKIIDKLKKEELENWHETSSIIAFKVLKKMDELCINKIQLSLLLKVSPSYITKLLKGHQNMTLETLLNIEKVLGLKVLGTDDNSNSGYEILKNYTSISYVLDYQETPDC